MVAALIVVGVAAPGGTAAEAQESESTVRVAARRLVDGIVEVALQQQTNGSWTARLLPERRLFPAEAVVGHWLVSTPLDIDGTGARVVARRAGGGAIEFGVQVRKPDGTWGSRLLPDRRWFPTDIEVGRWLASSPVLLAAAPNAAPGALTAPAPLGGPLEEALAVARRLAPEIVAPTGCRPAPLDDASLLPNAPRVYRSGVHQGVDYDCDAPGYDAVAAFDGRVVVAVGDYGTPTPDQREAILAVAEQRQSTPPFTLLMLYGNYVVIDHDFVNGAGHVVTLYAHLQRLHPNIRAGVAVRAGDPLGLIGNTGTEHDAADNPDRGIHLHWELHVNDRYLAAGLSPAQTRTVYTALLDTHTLSTPGPP